MEAIPVGVALDQINGINKSKNVSDYVLKKKIKV